MCVEGVYNDVCVCKGDIVAVCVCKGKGMRVEECVLSCFSAFVCTPVCASHELQHKRGCTTKHLHYI